MLSAIVLRLVRSRETKGATSRILEVRLVLIKHVRESTAPVRRSCVAVLGRVESCGRLVRDVCVCMYVCMLN